MKPGVWGGKPGVWGGKPGVCGGKPGVCGGKPGVCGGKPGDCMACGMLCWFDGPAPPGTWVSAVGGSHWV